MVGSQYQAVIPSLCSSNSYNKRGMSIFPPPLFRYQAQNVIKVQACETHNITLCLSVALKNCHLKHKLILRICHIVIIVIGVIKMIYCACGITDLLYF